MEPWVSPSKVKVPSPKEILGIAFSYGDVLVLAPLVDIKQFWLTVKTDDGP